MVRESSTFEQLLKIKDLSGGLLLKQDPARMDPRFFRDARNMRFGSGSPQTRAGSVRAATLTRPAGALSFVADATKRVEVPANGSCPIWSGLGPDFTLEWVENVVAKDPFPTQSKGLVWEVGVTSPSDEACFSAYAKSASPFNRYFSFVEDGESLVEKLIGTVDNDGSDPSDKRYYCRVRRQGKDLDVLMVGAAGGAQYTVFAGAFQSATSKLEAATTPLYIGGYGIDGTTYSVKSKIDELRFWNCYLDDTRRYYWSGHPMLEDAFLLLRLGFDEGSGTVVYDDSLYGNHGVLVNAPSRVGGIIEGLAVGQLIGEFSPPGMQHRLVAAGGDLFRQVVR